MWAKKHKKVFHQKGYWDGKWVQERCSSVGKCRLRPQCVTTAYLFE